MFMLISELFLILFINLTSVSGNTKSWNSFIDINNNDNWNLKRIPCANDRLILPEDVVIYLNQELKGREIVLPKNGRIILGDKSSINLFGTDDHCDGKDNSFEPKRDSYWFDPYNWNQIITGSYPMFKGTEFIGSSDDFNPIPHMERVPCSLDSVTFPIESSFKVTIDSDIKIKSIGIWNKDFDSNSFRSFLDSDEGKQLFSLKNSINFEIENDLVCNDRKGCVCGNEKPEILSRVCRAVLKRGCPSLHCSDPIRPVGHCCDTCASMLTFSYKPDFSLELVEGTIEEFQRKAEYTSVGSYLHKLVSDRFQFIAVDLSEKGRAHAMVSAIKQYFDDGPGIYSIEAIEVRSSTEWISGGGGGWVVLIFFILLLIGGAVGTSYYLKKRSAPFAFARFHGSDVEEGVELRVGTTPHEALDPNATQMSTSSVKFYVEPNVDKDVVTFENPMFERHVLKEKENQLLEKSSQLINDDNPFQ